MSAEAETLAEEHVRELAKLDTRRLQLVYASVTALVLIVVSLADAARWGHPSIWLASLCIGAATVLALLDGRLPRSRAWLRYALPGLDLLGCLALLADFHSPRIIAMLAVVPAFWLGIVAGRWGIAIVGAVGAAMSAVLALHLTGSANTTLTANAVGIVLVPAVLIAAAWFARNYSRALVRQQRAIVEREREKTAIARQAAADAALLDAIFETARVGLMVLDPDGGIVRVNPTLAGHPVMGEAPVGSALDHARFLELESRRPIDGLDTPFMRAARGESFDNVDCWVERPGHDLVAVRMSSRPLLLDGEFRGSIASVDDVTAYMRMLEDRDDFVALVSHELRTPLTSISGYLEIALDEELPRDLRSWLETVQRNANRLRALVEDLLIVGEMSRGEMQLHHEIVDLRGLASDAAALLQHRARRKRVQLTLADGPAARVEGDPRRLSQVIENLISNGIKYTRDGGAVAVSVELRGADAVVSVVDDGPGIEAAEAERVFERFYRSASARASGLPGAGLGLWICRTIINAHGGTIGFSSEQGVGSVASFRLARAD
ncbi:cell wall metabolism sensor histidine kinase WalK [Agrococcus sp. HG114]|uniref:sensor histidine kinase n=1 Tax=Agrococcus sp. HG114 TaxID=2969757 RepID=UPI00215A829A|nr:ATP-binding protein [Agrococcus sp. HG114]MCR8670381.1 ATP-binding protein [Agrococcus sp. HG114]